MSWTHNVSPLVHFRPREEKNGQSINFNISRCRIKRKIYTRDQDWTWTTGSPGEGGYGEDSEQELEAVETEQDGAEQELQPQDVGLQQQVVNSQSCTGKQNEERRTRGQRALTQVPLPTWINTQHTRMSLSFCSLLADAADVCCRHDTQDPHLSRISEDYSKLNRLNKTILIILLVFF